VPSPGQPIINNGPQVVFRGIEPIERGTFSGTKTVHFPDKQHWVIAARVRLALVERERSDLVSSHPG